jgi:hypothetical protein
MSRSTCEAFSLRVLDSEKIAFSWIGRIAVVERHVGQHVDHALVAHVAQPEDGCLAHAGRRVFARRP